MRDFQCAVRFLLLGVFVLCVSTWCVNAQVTITVFATVTDTQGAYVSDLQKDDFEIVEDGKSQSPVSVDRDTRPLRVLVMLDRSGSMNGAYPPLFEAVATFLTRLHPHDKVRVGGFSDRIEFGSQFTADPRELLGDLSALDHGNDTKLWDGMLAADDQL